MKLYSLKRYITAANLCETYKCLEFQVKPVAFQNAHLSLAPPETGYHGFASGTNGEGFFRFTVNETTFRLMLLSKDKQNLLKIISYDFLLVGMQVSAASRMNHD